MCLHIVFVLLINDISICCTDICNIFNFFVFHCSRIWWQDKLHEETKVYNEQFSKGSAALRGHTDGI